MPPREQKESVGKEAVRNWFTDIVIHFLMDKFRTVNEAAWMDLVFAFQRHQVEARASVVIFAEGISRIIEALPVAHVPIIGSLAQLKYAAGEMLERLEASFEMYARGQRIDFPADYEVHFAARFPDLGLGLQRAMGDFRDWCLRTTGLWKYDLSQVVMTFLPALTSEMHHRDEHVAAISCDPESFTWFAGFIGRVPPEKRGSVIRCYSILNQPAFLKRLREVQGETEQDTFDQQLAMLDLYSRNSVDVMVEAVNRGLLNVQQAVCGPVDDWIAERRRAREGIPVPMIGGGFHG